MTDLSILKLIWWKHDWWCKHRHVSSFPLSYIHCSQHKTVIWNGALREGEWWTYIKVYCKLFIVCHSSSTTSNWKLLFTAINNPTGSQTLDLRWDIMLNSHWFTGMLVSFCHQSKTSSVSQWVCPVVLLLLNDRQ